MAAEDDDIVQTGEPPKEEPLTSLKLIPKGITRNKMDLNKYRTQEDINASIRTLANAHKTQSRSKQSNDNDERFRNP